MIYPNVLMTFNVNPDDRHQYYDAPKQSVKDADRLDRFMRFWRTFFDRITEYDIEVYLQVEASEPYKGSSAIQRSRLHFHGYIRFPDIDSLKWFHLYGCALINQCAVYEIDTIEDPRYWYEYVHKQKFLMWPRIATVALDNEIPLAASVPFLQKNMPPVEEPVASDGGAQSLDGDRELKLGDCHLKLGSTAESRAHHKKKAIIRKRKPKK